MQATMGRERPAQRQDAGLGSSAENGNLMAVMSSVSLHGASSIFSLALAGSEPCGFGGVESG